MVIEVPDVAPPGSPPQFPDATSRSSQGSRPSTAGGEPREEGRGPVNQLLTPWGQTELQVTIGIDEVGLVVYCAGSQALLVCFPFMRKKQLLYLTQRFTIIVLLLFRDLKQLEN